MKKVAIFVEGLTELIFVKNLLFRLFSRDEMSYLCLKSPNDNPTQKPFDKHSGSQARIYFQIIAVNNDKLVLKTIKERQNQLVNRGFDTIIGLRDMSSDEFFKKSQSVNEKVIQLFIDKVNGQIQSMPHASKINFHFAIMELEAWWLGMYNLFAKIDTQLTPQFIQQHLGYDLTQIDPQTKFLRPHKEIDQILRLIGLTYDKHAAEIETITKKIKKDDIEQAIEHGRCASFKQFYDSLAA